MFLPLCYQAFGVGDSQPCAVSPCDPSLPQADAAASVLSVMGSGWAPFTRFLKLWSPQGLKDIGFYKVSLTHIGLRWVAWAGPEAVDPQATWRAFGSGLLRGICVSLGFVPQRCGAFMCGLLAWGWGL